MITGQTHEPYTDIISAIVQKTQSDLIIFAIILIIGLVLVYIPYYIMKKKANAEYNKNQLEEKKMLYSVINRNSDIAATLTTTIDANNTAITTVLSNIKLETHDLNKAVSHLSDNQLQIIEKLNDSIKCNRELKNYVEKSVELNEQTGDISKYLQDVIRDLEYIKIKLTEDHHD